MNPLTTRGALAAGLWGLSLCAMLHITQQCLAGYVQCSALGCLPW